MTDTKEHENYSPTFSPVDVEPPSPCFNPTKTSQHVQTLLRNVQAYTTLSKKAPVRDLIFDYLGVSPTVRGLTNQQIADMEAKVVDLSNTEEDCDVWREKVARLREVLGYSLSKTAADGVVKAAWQESTWLQTETPTVLPLCRLFDKMKLLDLKVAVTCMSAYRSATPKLPLRKILDKKNYPYSFEHAGDFLSTFNKFTLGWILEALFLKNQSLFYKTSENIDTDVMAFRMYTVCQKPPLTASDQRARARCDETIRLFQGQADVGLLCKIYDMEEMTALAREVGIDDSLVAKIRKTHDSDVEFKAALCGALIMFFYFYNKGACIDPETYTLMFPTARGVPPITKEQVARYVQLLPTPEFGSAMARYLKIRHPNVCLRDPSGEEAYYMNVHQSGIETRFTEYPGQWSSMNACVARTKKRFVYIPIGLTVDKNPMGHFNFVLFDKKTQTAEMFEPHGAQTDFLNNGSEVYETLATLFKQKLRKCKTFLFPVGLNGLDGFQELQTKLFGDLEFCATCMMWGYWYADLRMMHADTQRERLLHKVRDIFNADRSLIADVVRAFLVFSINWTLFVRENERANQRQYKKYIQKNIQESNIWTVKFQ